MRKCLKVYFGETLSEEAKKVLGYLVAKNIPVQKG